MLSNETYLEKLKLFVAGWTWWQRWNGQLKHDKHRGQIAMYKETNQLQPFSLPANWRAIGTQPCFIGTRRFIDILSIHGLRWWFSVAFFSSALLDYSFLFYHVVGQMASEKKGTPPETVWVFSIHLGPHDTFGWSFFILSFLSSQWASEWRPDFSLFFSWFHF